MIGSPLPIVGVELGGRLETTALSVTERAYVPTGERFNASRYGGGLEGREKVAVEYRVRHLERFSPPVRYARVAGRVAELVRAVGGAAVVVDVTRTGRPVYELIMRTVVEGLKGTEARVKPGIVTITGVAGGVSKSPDAGWLVPRRDLASAALLLFEQSRLKIAESLDLAETLAEELAGFKLKPDPRDDLDGWREAKNDDLVLAVAMSVWAAERFLRKKDSVPVASLGGLGPPRAAV